MSGTQTESGLPEMQRYCTELRASLQAREAEVAALADELDETNRGVVALYAQLDDKAEQLRQAVELKSRFLSYMSHEFRTPLSSMRSVARLLLDGYDGTLNPEQRKQVVFVQAAAVELTEMVDDLLDLARVEAGRLQVSAGWFDLVDLFTALRGMFKPLVENTGVDLIFEEPVAVPSLYGDDKKLTQILRNFISNALKFTSTGEVRVTAHKGDAEVRFSVIDTGIGIDAQFHGAVFQDFVQVESPVQKRWRGSGLGLSLSRQLAELLGGRVGLESELGKGSTFWVALPLTAPSTAAAPQ
jgi:signal transduction histidine kinase